MELQAITMIILSVAFVSLLGSMVYLAWNLASKKRFQKLVAREVAESRVQAEKLEKYVASEEKRLQSKLEEK